MANVILTNCRLYVGGYDLSGDTNKLSLLRAAEGKDNTTFGAVAHSRIAGLKDVTFHHDGFYNVGATQPGDTQLFSNIGSADQVATILVDPVDGDPGYFFQGFESNYTPNGAIGDVFGYGVDISADGDLYSGTIMLPPSPALAASGNGTIRQLGAVGAAQSVRASLHVFSVAGTGNPSLTATVQSAAAVGFASPTSRISFTGATAVGAQFGGAAGAITDQYWRVNYAITGTTPSFSAVVVVSIQ